jgi:hypothetical protein
MNLSLVGRNVSLELDICDSVGSNVLSFLFPLASPSSLPDGEIDLDASFSQKILVGYLPYRATVESILHFSPRLRTETLRTNASDARCAKSSRTAMGVMNGGTNSIWSRQMRKQGTG